MPSSSRNRGSASQGRPVQSPTCPAPSAPASHRAKKPIDATALANILARVGLAPLALMRDEAARARQTPGISFTTFFKIIGARCKSEWGVSERIPGYEYLCADLVAQPYVPMAPGKPGIVIRPPTTVWTAQNEYRMFQVFSGTPARGRDNLAYRGAYTAVPDIQIELDWFDLPFQVRMLKARHVSGYVSDIIMECRDVWLKRFTSTSPPAYRALRARIKLRNELKREPSTAEVLKFLRSHSDDGLLYKDVSAAFRANEEVRRNLRFRAIVL